MWVEVWGGVVGGRNHQIQNVRREFPLSDTGCVDFFFFFLPCVTVLLFPQPNKEQRPASVDQLRCLRCCAARISLYRTPAQP